MEEREILHLIWGFLHTHSLSETADHLEKEAKYDVTLPPKFPGGPPPPLQKILDDFLEARLLRQKESPLSLPGGGSVSENHEKEDEEFLGRKEEQSDRSGNLLETALEGYELPKKEIHQIREIHATNPLTVRFKDESFLLILATGGADRLVNLVDAQTGDLIGNYEFHKAGILGINFHPQQKNILLVHSMDSSCSLIDTDLDGKDSLKLSWKHHSKFVSRAVWSPCGNYLATGSYDKTGILYKYDQKTFQIELLKKFFFKGTVESVCFSRDSAYVIFASRDDNYLHYCCLGDLSSHRFNMNANGDDFVSFTAMEMAVHPSGKYLAVSTDKSRLIIFRIFSAQQVTNIYSIVNDGMSQPRICWDHSGKFLFATQENDICVLSVARQETIHRLKGHQGIVRDLHLHPSSNRLVSASYDGSFRVWG